MSLSVLQSKLQSIHVTFTTLCQHLQSKISKKFPKNSQQISKKFDPITFSLYLQWKFKLWAGKFAWGVKAKHCWALSTFFLFSKVCWHHPAMFCLITLLPQVNFPAHNLNFHWRWRWWDRIHAIFLNLFYFTYNNWKFIIT